MQDAALRRLCDLEAIRDLARRYAHCVWQKDVAGAADLFAEDGVMDTGDRPPLVGRQALFDEYSEVFSRLDFYPFVHNHVIELAGDRATGTCYLHVRSSAEGTPQEGFGFYLDEYVRVGADGDADDREWKFRKRRLEMAHFGEVGSGP